MDNNLITSGEPNLDTGSTAFPTSKVDTYVVLNPLPSSRLEWLSQQSLRVAEVSRQSISPQGPG